MRQHKAEGVILDTTDVFDADRTFLLFTRELGKVRARAKGVRRPTSKLGGHLLPYLPVQLELVESGEWYLIVQAQIISRYAQESVYPENPINFLRQVSLLAEAINKLFIDKEPHPEIYEGLVYTLDRLRELAEQPGEQKSTLVVAEFLFKALAELGYRPELQHCVLTGQKITEDFVGWNSQLGGVLSKEGYTQVASGQVLRHARSLVVLRQFMQPQFVAERLTVPEEVLQEAVELVNNYIQTQLGQPLKVLQ